MNSYCELGRCVVGVARLEQTVEVDHHIFHLSIINRALRRAAPRFFCARHVGIDADNVDIVEIGKFEAPRIFNPATENEMQFAHDISPI